VEAIRRFRGFLGETLAELKKSTWPTRKEVYGTTVVVIVTVFICAVYLFFVDMILSRGMNAVLGFFE
jgi:preprotein translocase subunit SecE